MYASSLIWLKVSKLITDLTAKRWLTSTLYVMSCGRRTKWETAQSYSSKNQKSCHSPRPVPVIWGSQCRVEKWLLKLTSPCSPKRDPRLVCFCGHKEVSVSNHFPMEPGSLFSEVVTLPQKVKYRLKKG